jgi:RimJ/RimL family protein N-acetyltransferase
MLSEATIIGKKTLLFPIKEQDYDLFVELYNENLDQVTILGKTNILETLKNAIKCDKIHIWVGCTNNGKASEKVGFLYLTEYTGYSASVHGFISKKFLKDIIKQMKTKYTYTEDAYKAFIDFCFNELKLERLGTTIKRQNDLAYRIDKKLGFKLDGVLRRAIKEKDGEFSDAVVLSIIKSDRAIDPTIKVAQAIPDDKKV